MFARRRAPIGAALAALAFLQLPALAAQDRRTEFRTATGSIELPPAGASEPLARGELKLAPQGAFELQVFGTRQFTKWTLKGQYVGQQWSNRIEVRLNDALGDGNAVGDGFVTFDQFNAVREVELTGRTRGGERFAVRLRGDGSGAQQPPVVAERDPDVVPGPRPDSRPGPGPVVPFTEFDRTQDGRGIFRTWNDEARVRRLRVQLRRDGTFELRAETETGRRTVRGRWRDQGRDGVELRVVDFDGDRGDRRGVVILRGNDIVRVQVGDDRGRDGATLRFATDRRWDEDDWGRGGWDRDDDWDRDGRGGRPGWDVPRDYNRTLNARGTVDVPFAGRLDVNRAELRLDRNGDARLRLHTWERGRDRRIDLRGTWLPGDRNDRGTVRIRWTRIENQVADGDALVTFWDGRDAQRLRGLGRTRDGRFSVSIEFDR